MPYKDPEKQKKAQHESYLRTKGEVAERSKNARDAIRQYVRDLKTETPCADCGLNYHYCAMQFDHLEGEEKIETVCRLTSSRSLAKVKREIEKCEIVCSNCHHVRSFSRMVNKLHSTTSPHG